MDLSKKIARHWRATADDRRRAIMPLLGIFTIVMIIPVGVLDPDFGGLLFLMYLCGMPYFAYSLVYSQRHPPQSRYLWWFFLFASLTIYCLFACMSLFGRNGMGIAEMVVVSLLTIFAMAQIRFLFRVRRQMRQSLVEVRDWT